MFASRARLSSKKILPLLEGGTPDEKNDSRLRRPLDRREGYEGGGREARQAKHGRATGTAAAARIHGDKEGGGGDDEEGGKAEEGEDGKRKVIEDRARRC